MFIFPNASDKLVIFIFIIVISFIVLFPFSYFGGVLGLFIGVIFLASSLSYLYAYGIGLGKSFANAQPTEAIDWRPFILLAKLAVFYAVFGYGMFLICELIKGNESNIPLIVLWLVVFVGSPFIIYAQQVYTKYNQTIRHYTTSIVLTHSKEFPIILDQLIFFNSNKKKGVRIPFSLDTCETLANKYELISEENEPLVSQKLYYTHSRLVSIPVNFKQFELSWYSVLENRFYKDVFLVKREHLVIEQNYDGQMTVSNMLINILPDGHVDLLMEKCGDINHVTPYWDVAYKELDATNPKAISQLLSDEKQSANLVADIKEIHKQITAKFDAKNLSCQLLAYRKLYPFALKVSLKETSSMHEVYRITVVDFYMNKYRRRPATLEKIANMPLPNVLKFDIYDAKELKLTVKLFFDKLSLWNSFESWPEVDKEQYKLDVNLDMNDLQKSEVMLTANNKQLTLHDWMIFADK